MAIITGGTTGGGGTGTVTSVSSANNSITVATATTTPALTVGTVDKLFTNNAPAAALAMNSQKLTGLAAGSGAGDSLRYEQVIGANVLAVGNLVAGTAGQVLGGTGPSYALPPGFEINYTQITTTVNVSSTTEATPTTVISPGAITFDGTPVIVEFFCPGVVTDTNAATDQLFVCLFEGATEITRLAGCRTVVTAANAVIPVRAAYRFTPTAASHTYTISAWAQGATAGQIQAGAGGTGTLAPAFVRFTKV